jgi:hypothetical protein
VSAAKATKLKKFCLYRMRVMHGLKLIDAPQRINFCNWMLKNVHNGLVDPKLMFISDEVYFCLRTYINSQKATFNRKMLLHILM